MILSAVSIKRPVFATMMSVAIVFFGLIALQKLPVRELPDIDPPIVSVTTVYQGANAAVVETEVTERLEEAINNIEGIKILSSSSREEVSAITVEFDLSRNIDLAAQDVRDRVSRVRGLLPDAIKDPIVAKQDADAQAVLWIAINSDRFTTLELSTIAEKQIKNRLQTIKGVSSIIIGGEQRFAIRLWLDSSRMAAHQLTVLDVERALKEQNVELPSGRVESVEREMIIETRGELKTAEEFNNLVLYNDGTKIVRLRDVGVARGGVENERTVARNNGKPCVFLGIVKQSKANTIEVAHGIKAEVERIKPILPAGIEMVFNYDESIYVENSVHEVWVTLAIAFLLVIIVIYLFLRDFRSTIIPVVAIPVSLVGTFAIMNTLGYSVNILTMLALVLSIGVVVDDAIVVLENIFRHIEEGVPPMKAAYKAMEEIGFAIVAITITLVAVFLPLAFQKSSTGRLFTEFAVAVAGSVIISAFVALSLSPMMASRILQPIQLNQKHVFFIEWFDHFFDAVNRTYKRLLGWSLRHRFFVMMIALASLALTVLAFTRLESEFLPEEDKGRLLCFVFAPEGSTSEYTDRMLKKMEKIIVTIPELQAYGAIVSPAFSGPGQANFGIVFLRLKDERKRSVQEIVNGPGGLKGRFFAEVEGAIAVAQIPKAISRSFGSPFQLILKAQNLDELNKYSEQLLNKLRPSGYLQNARSSFEYSKPELRLNIDRDRAASLGVSIQEISRTLQMLFGGLDLSRIKLDGKEYKVITQLERTSRQTPQDVDKLYVRNNKRELIQLSSIVSYQTGPSPNAIEHYNRIRSTTISASIVGVPLGTAVARVEELLKNDLPAGFTYEFAGESRDLKESGTEVWWVMIIALIIVYMVLAAQFESLIHPLTVMLAIPLAGLGAYGSLWLISFINKLGIFPEVPAMNDNLFSKIGIILLVGLVTKNSILLVEFANQQREKGASAFDAMMQAGTVRLRPILMTAFSTIAGILPIAIGFGAGAESRRPMGVAVVGGMVTSTFLTLLVIPVVYTVFSGLAERFSRKTKVANSGHEPSEVLAK